MCKTTAALFGMETSLSQGPQCLNSIAFAIANACRRSCRIASECLAPLPNEADAVLGELDDDQKERAMAMVISLALNFSLPASPMREEHRLPHPLGKWRPKFASPKFPIAPSARFAPHIRACECYRLNACIHPPAT